MHGCETSMCSGCECDYGKHGASHRTQHAIHHQHEVPAHWDFLYTWSSFKLEAPTPNKHYQCEWQTIRCNPGFKDKPTIFDPIIVETEPQQSGWKRACLDSTHYLVDPLFTS